MHSHDFMKLPNVDAARQKDWLYVLKYFVDKGLVFRLVGPTFACWDAGLMEKKGNKYVWSKKTPDELKEKGISFTRQLRKTYLNAIKPLAVI